MIGPVIPTSSSKTDDRWTSPHFHEQSCDADAVVDTFDDCGVPDDFFGRIGPDDSLRLPTRLTFVAPILGMAFRPGPSGHERIRPVTTPGTLCPVLILVLVASVFSHCCRSPIEPIAAFDGRHSPALGIGPGSEIRAPMALAVIGGLVVSTALSLLVVPAFYLVADRVKERLRKGEAEPALPVPPADGARP